MQISNTRVVWSAPVPYPQFILVTLLAFAFWLPSAHAHPPVDYGRYLESRNIGPLIPMNVEVPSRNGTPSPLFVTKDDLGNRYSVIVPSTQGGVHERLALSQVAQLFGLPRAPLWPILIADRTSYHVGLASPLAHDNSGVVTFNSRDELSPQATADVFTSFVFTYLFSASTYGRPWNIDGKIVHTSPHLPFEDIYDPEKRKKLGLRTKIDSLEKLERTISGRPALNALAKLGDAQKIAEFQFVVNDFLSRVESSLESPVATAPPLFEKILTPMIEYGGWPQPANLIAKTKEIAGGLRKETLDYLRQINPTLVANFPDRLKFTMQPRTFDQAKYVVGWGQPFPTFGPGWETHAKDYLWNLVLSRPDIRVKLIAQWGKDLGVPDPLPVIAEKATTYDSRVFLTVKENHDISMRQVRDESPQFQINGRIQRGLVVVAANDQEGRAIAAVAKQLAHYFVQKGAEQLRVYPDLREYRNGEELTNDDFHAILNYAVTHKFTTLIVCELGGLTPRMKEELKAKGIELISLDHHNTLSKYSTIEQFADLYNYHLSYNQFITAMLDKGGVSALVALGLTKSEVRSYLEHTGQLERIRATLEAPWAQGAVGNTFYRIENGDGSLGEYSRALGYLHYPEMPSFLIWNDRSVRFAGPHSVCRDLKAEMESKFAGRWVTGGDLSRGFFIFRPDRLGTPPQRVAQAFEVKIKELHTYSCAKILTGDLFHH